MAGCSGGFQVMCTRLRSCGSLGRVSKWIDLSSACHIDTRKLLRTWETEEGIWLGAHSDADHCCLWLFVDLAFPVVDFVLFWYW